MIEIKKYFSFTADRIAFYQGERAAWLLRTPSKNSRHEKVVAAVFSDGRIGMRDRVADLCDNRGIRPALWVNLDDKETRKIEPATVPLPDENGVFPVELYRIRGSDLNPHYAEKIVEIQGQIKKFSNSNNSGFYIELQDEMEVKIECYFTDSAEIAKVAELFEDSAVIVTGKYTSGKYSWSDSVLQECKIRLVDGNGILPTIVPPIENNICVLTVDEYIALDVARNSVRAAVLFGGAQVEITAKITDYAYWEARTWLFQWLDSYSFYIGRTGQTIDCALSEGQYRAYRKEFSKGDTVKVIGRPSSSNSSALSSCTITKAAP